jgi:hypothetical protein
MATHVFDDTYDATIRPTERLAAKLYRVQVNVGYRNGSLTGSSYTGEGSTAKQAEAAALATARDAIASGKIKSKE